MSCSGSCFDIGQFRSRRAPEPQWDVHKAPTLIENGSDRREEGDGTSPLYAPLHPWQTRLLRLPSAEEFSFDGHRCLKARLFVVDLPIIEGAVLVSEQRMVHYTALSYTWGDPPIGHTLSCDDHELAITANLAAALLALQRATEEVFLWVDAICINQDDRKEVQEQVVKMLQIYQKAEMVVGWLGLVDAKSTLAISCIRNCAALEDRMRKAHPWSFHSPECHAIVNAILCALTSLLERNWLGRTWVRQEIYGARNLKVQCGSQMLEWIEFASAADIIQGFAELFADLKPLWRAHVATVLDLVTEAKKNRIMLQPGVKLPRSLNEVLLMSRHFGVGIVQDTVYGVLGMCAVPTSAGSSPQSMYDRYGEYVIGIDYSKTVEHVYLDTALHLLSTKRLEALADLWHRYIRSPRHDQGMPTWAIDWREGVCDETDIKAVQDMLEQVLEHGAVYNTSSATFTNSGREFRRPTLELLERPFTMDFAHDQNRSHIWPKPMKKDPRILHVSCRVLNYVAHVSDFTADLKVLISLRRHPRRKVEGGLFLLGSVPVIPFQPGTHHRRLAILGTSGGPRFRDSSCEIKPQLALVPATARKGDLVVAVEADLLPILLRPLRSNLSVSTALFPNPDPYEASHVICPAPGKLFFRAVVDLKSPRSDPDIEATLDDASARFGTDFDFHGPVFLGDRQSYFHRDVRDRRDMLLQDFRVH